MVELRGRAHRLHKPCRELWIVGWTLKQFDDDLAREARLFCEITDRHAPTTQRAQDLVWPNSLTNSESSHIGSTNHANLRE
jgi:hypothetical protein